MHSLPPNSTCLYHLQGTEVSPRTFEQLQMMRRGSALNPSPSRFKVWLSILKFEYGPKFGLPDENSLLMQPTEDCSAILRIWDGSVRELPHCKDPDCTRDDKDAKSFSKYGQNQTSLMTRFCRGQIPRSCDHFMMNQSINRPCTLSESFVSSTDSVTMELRNTESTVLRPLNFRLKYEFVDNIQDGQPMGLDTECNRKFISSQIPDKKEPLLFRGVKNVFFFGRGGQLNMR